MYLKKAFIKNTGRTYLSLAHGYRDKEKGRVVTKIVESFGYLDELEKIYDDPIAHFTKIVEERNLAQKQDTAEYNIIAKKNETLNNGTMNRRNYGYIVIMKILHELGLEQFLIRKRQATNIEYNTAAIMKLLVISRILSPGSKKSDYDKRGRYFDFERADVFKLEDVYRALSHFAELSKDIQRHIHDRLTKAYGRDMNLIYYDVTNYYFEIDKEDSLRKKGVSKEHRPDPIVQMGLSMDAEGMPISYEMFPGNESEKLHLRPMIFEVLNRYEAGKVIAVADSAQNTGNNIYYLNQGKQGYVFSQSIRGGSEEFKKYVIDPDGYEWYGEKYKRKSQIVRREIQVDFNKDEKTFKKKILVDQRQIVFYSEKYAVRSREKREAALKKAGRIISNPSAYTKATSYGVLKYIKNIEIDKKTGEIKESKGTPCFNVDVITEEEKYDGYHALVSNVFNEGKNKGEFDDDKIIDIYHGLWRIEDSFRVTKGDLETRPIFLSRTERINAHFLICFIALIVIRLLQKLTKYKHSPAKLIEALNNISCSNENENIFLFDYRDEITDDLGRAFDIDFTKKRLTRAEIKKNLGIVKKN